jgi:hypothetical protein
MPIQYKNTDACNSLLGCGCLDKFGCPPGVCPDFTVRRHDTKPPLRIEVTDCGQPMDLANRVLEINMWAKSKLKASILATDTQIAFADGIGFEQLIVGDTIIMERVRGPEHMLVTGFDEDAKTILVMRGWNGTTASAWKKGSSLRIFRVLNSPAETEMVFEDVEEIEGTISRDVLRASYFIYEWKPQDTCLPGCYYLEFKLIKMKDLSYFLPGGHWTGLLHKDAAGNFLTGSVHSDSSVLLSQRVLPVLPHDEIEAREEKAVEGLEAQFGPWEELGREHGINGFGIGYEQGVLIDREDINSIPPGESLFSYTGDPRAFDEFRTEPTILWLLPSGGVWTGPTHLHSDGNYYTGSVQDDGSVYLNNTGIASNESVAYNSAGLTSVTPILDYTTISTTSVNEVSTTSIGQCQLGSGVEWIRRYPTSGDGFLIRIEDSPTAEG